MSEPKESSLYDSQITTVVHGFLQVWNKFEVILSKELAQIQDRLEGIHPEKEHQPSSNHELFYRVSSCILPKGSVTMSELSNALSVPMSTATRMVDWLVNNGYVERLPDPEDRRVVRVALTATGKEFHRVIDGHVRQRIKQIFSSLSDEERITLLTLIGKVVFALREVTQE